MDDPTLASHVAEWFGVCNRLWPILWESDGLSPAHLRARADIQLLYAELRQRTKPLAEAAGQRGISSQPLHELTGFLEGAKEETWNAAWAVIKRLESIAAAQPQSHPSATERPPWPTADIAAKAASRQALLELFQRRGLAPVAYLCEAAWNLREWLREVVADHTLEPVLSSFLPTIRRQIELNLLDGELSRFAGDLPAGEKLTAASLVGFIEGLTLPGKARIMAPPGTPSLQWTTLSRMRTLRIAMQTVRDDGTPAFDSKSESDLNTIEQTDHKVLVRLWNAIESVDPINEPGGHKVDSTSNVETDKISGLRPTERKALDVIERDGPIAGKTLANRIHVAESTLRRHIIPKLRPFGVKNEGAGYYVAPRSAT